MDRSQVSIVQADKSPDQAEIMRMVKATFDNLGGINCIINKGDFIAIKGNFFAPFPPPVTVDRRVVYALIRVLFEAGASRVVLAEAVSVGTKLGRNTNTSDILDELGVREAALSAGAEVLCLEDDERVWVDVEGGKSIDRAYYPKTILNCDKLIDLCCLKTHMMTTVTLGIKNFQGLLNDEQKYYAHRDDLEPKLVDLFKIRKPDFTLIDGLIAMEGNGAGEEGKPKIMNLLIGSNDVVSAESVGCAVMGIEDTLDVPSVRIAQYEGIGIADLRKIDVVGNTIEQVKQKFELPITNTKPQDRLLVSAYKNVDVRVGGACKQCYLLATLTAMSLGVMQKENFTMIIGSDPKLGAGIKGDLDRVIIFGDCACAATGEVKELRNKMLLENKGCIAEGCPPYRPASAKIKKYLSDRGLTNAALSELKAQAKTKKFYDFYKSVDNTWVPKSERNKNG